MRMVSGKIEILKPMSMDIYQYTDFNWSVRQKRAFSYIGNFLNLTPPDKEFIMEIKENIRPIDWKKVEEDVLTKYFLYNKRESVIYGSLDR